MKTTIITPSKTKEKTKEITSYLKTIKIIISCTTFEQLDVAKKYMDLFIKSVKIYYMLIDKVKLTYNFQSNKLLSNYRY